MITTWTIGQKLITSFVAVAGITLVIGLVGNYGAVKSNKAIGEIGTLRLPSVSSLLAISRSAESIAVAQRTLLIPDLNPDDRIRQPESAARAKAAYEAAWKILTPPSLSPLVATTVWGMPFSRSHASIWTSSLVGPISPSTRTKTMTRLSRSRR